MFHKIYDGAIPDFDTASYMLDTTYNYRYTPTAKPDSFQIDTFALPSLTRTICDLDAYPVVCNTVTVWPPYNTVDTIRVPAIPTDTFEVIPPDVVQDSALVYFVAATDTLSLWQDVFAYLNDDYPINPPTIGVATMDGLNENGYPYDFSTAFTYGKADYLTSKPIFMNQNASGVPYTIADSIYLSFYYQPQGLGNEPEIEDSLVLQFWSPNDNAWFTVWKTDTVIIDTNFTQVMVKITDSKYLEAGFKFRFLNYASLSGSFDHWHIDYVYLDRFRFSADTVRDDVAMQYPVQSLIKKYTSMPWKHFKWDVQGNMLDSIFALQRNNNTSGRLVGGNELDILYQGTLQQTILNTGTPSISGLTNFSTLFVRPAMYYFDTTTTNDTNASFEIEISHNTTPDFCRLNDTFRFTQEFIDYYSYDDGTAEAAYGVQGLGGLNSKIASKFNLAMGDTLKSVFIHFTPSAYNFSSTNFIITVWNDAGGKPGSVIYEKVTLDVPRYNIGVNGYYEYPLDSNHFLNAGTYYVGVSQTTPDRINIGFDKNINNRFNTFYNSNGTWRITGFEGSLMIRPSFVYGRDFLVGLEDVSDIQNFSIFPNPANSTINIKAEGDLSKTSLMIVDITGKIIYQGSYQDQIDVSQYKDGVYLIVLLKEDGRRVTSKFVKN